MPLELTGLFSVRQAAATLGIHEKTLFRWLREGRVVPIIIAGRRLIPESEVERLRKEVGGDHPQQDSGGDIQEARRADGNL